MPVIRASNRWHAEETRDALVEQLVTELRGEGADNGPVIFEVPIKQTDTFHVIVVWDKWQGVSPDDRSAMIHEAYAKLEESDTSGQPTGPRITIAIGATAEEAIDLGLLPYTVRPNVHKKHADFDEVRREMIKEGAIELPTGIELRFPSLQMAKDAFHRLRERTRATLPDVHWSIHQTVGAVDD